MPARSTSAVRLAYDVVEAAAASRDRRMAANAWISLAILVGITRHDFGQIEPILHAASAAVTADGARDLPRARLLASLSSITARVGTTRPGKRSKPCFQSTSGCTATSIRPWPSCWEVRRARSAQGHLEEAVPLYERSLDIIVRAYGPRHPMVAVVNLNLSNTLRSLGRYDEAQRHLDTATALETELFGADSEAAAYNLHARAQLELERGRPADALDPSRRAVGIWSNVLGPDHPRVAHALTTRGRALAALGRSDEAVEALARADGAAPEPDSAPAEERARTYFELARARWDGGGDRERARQEAETAVGLYTEAARAPQVREVQDWLAEHVLSPAR